MSQKATGVVESSEKVHIVPLKLIDADFKWNSRKGDPREESKIEGSAKNSFEELMQSIISEGQDEPIVVKPLPKGRYFLVAGFRRYAALSTINEDGTAKAFIRELSEAGARSLNIRENAARKQLRPVETAMRLVELQDLYKKEGKEREQGQIAGELGLDKTFASKLFSIERNLNKRALKLWHDCAQDVPVQKIYDISKNEKLSVEQQIEAVSKLTQPKATGDGIGEGSGMGRGSTKSLEERVQNVGMVLGRLHRLGRIGSVDLTDTVVVEACAQSGSKALKDEQQGAAAKALKAGWDEGIKEPEVEAPNVEGAAATAAPAN